MFASFDPLALDQACVDACLASQPIRASQLGDNACPISSTTTTLGTPPGIGVATCLEHAEKIGLGSRDYELITVK